MRKHKKTNLTKLLQPIVSAACVWALLLGLILPVAATETVSTEATEIKTETESTAAPTESELVLQLRSEAASYIETYGLTPDMPDQVLADIYTALDGEKAYAAWNKLNELLALAEGLTQDEADALLAEENTKLCQRFYNIIIQINTPMLAAHDQTYDPIEGISVNVTATDNDANYVDSFKDPTDPSKVIAKVQTHTSSGTCGGTEYNQHKVSAKIINTSGSTANLGFDWSIDLCDNSHSLTVTVSGTTAELTGSYSTNLPLENNESVTVTLKSCNKCDKNSTLTLSNFWITPVAKTSPVTFVYDSSFGSISVAGNAIESGETYDVPSDGGVSIAATANTNVTFLGWINDATGQRYSPDPSYTLKSYEPVTIRAVFIGANSSGWYLANNTHLFNDLNAATTFAKDTATYKTVTLMNDATLPKGDYTIPSGVTLLIPFDDDNTLCTTKPQTDSTALGYQAKPSAYRTLNMASGAHITVNGAISVSGTQHSAMARGTVVGPAGYIHMASGSTITVNNGGNLYVWGFIAGSGAVTVKSGGTVYESFQISDWRGGSATKAMQNNKENIFPVTQYHVQNVEVPMTLEAGAFEKGFMSVDVSYVGVQSTTIDFIGPNALFIINSGSITKDYDEATDRLIIDLNNCELNINTVTISVTVSILGSVKLSSSDYILPISSNITVNVNSGSSVDLSQDMAFLPGTELNIEQGATCSVTGDASIIFYDADNWGDFCGDQNLRMTYVSAVSSGTRASRATLADAAIKVNGTLDATNGYLYTTAAGGNIYSTGTGQVIQRAGTETKTYQATYVKDGYTANPITITPAKLKNGDGSFTDTSSATEATTYVYRNSIWCSHTDSDFTDSNKDHKCDTCGTVMSQCTDTNPKDHKCDACGTVMSQCTDSDGDGDHTCDYCGAENVTSHTPGAAATCTTPQTCTECGTEIKAALGHSYSSQVTKEPSCTETGTKTFTCASCGDSYTEDIPMTEHTWNGDTICDDCRIFKIYGTNLKVGDGLDIYFYVSSEVKIGSDWKVVFTRDGVETTPSITWETTADGMNRFCYEGIAAKEMTDVVTVTICKADGTPVSLPFKQSVENYTLQALSAYSSNTTLCTALVDMLNYGTAAQVNWNYHVERLANASLTDEQKNVGDVSAAYNTKMDEDEEVYKLFGATVSAKSNLYFTFYFDGIDPENLSKYSATTTYTTIYGGTRAKEYAGTEFEKLNYTSTENGTEITTTYYGPRVLDISTADGNMIVSCTLYVDGEPVTTVESSVESYVANAINTYDEYIKENTADSLASAQQMKPLVDMCKALKKFIDSSSTYFVSVNQAR